MSKLATLRFTASVTALAFIFEMSSVAQAPGETERALLAIQQQ